MFNPEGAAQPHPKEKNMPNNTTPAASPENDERVMELVQSLHDSDNRPSIDALYDLALAEGASIDLLARVAWSYVSRAGEYGTSEFYQITGLPYVAKLLAAGFAKEEVAGVIRRRCLEGDFADEHCKGLVVEPAARTLFDLNEATDLLTALVKQEPNWVLAQRYVLAEWLGGVREPDIACAMQAASTQGEAERKQRELVHIGLSLVEPVLIAAADVVTSLRSYAEISAMRSLPEVVRVMTVVSMRDARNSASVAYKGYVLINTKWSRLWKLRHQLPRGFNAHEALMRDLRTLIHDADDADEVYRWLTEGARLAGAQLVWTERRSTGELDHIPLWCDEFSQAREVRKIIQNAGWRFLPLTRRPSSLLEVSFRDGGRTVRIVYQAITGRDPNVTEGTEVIVPPLEKIRKNPKGFRLIEKNGEGETYAAELHPALPAVPGMKGSWQYFAKR
jgi:hypothetical protein